MATNTNVFPLEETLNDIKRGAQFVDFAGLDYFWTLAKAYTDKLASDEADAAETAAKSYADGLKATIDGVIAENERTTAESLTDLNDRVEVLEAIDHDQLAADAASSAVATILDGAPEKFDTLKEVADWIANSESAADAADLVTRVSTLETTVGKEADGENPATGLVKTVADMDAAYKAADTTLQGNIDTVAGDLAALETKLYGSEGVDGDIAKLEASLKKYADDGAAAAETASKAYYDDMIKSYYNKTEVDDLLTANSTADKAYADGVAAQALTDAKTYTDELFNSVTFVTKEQIDGLFA